MLGIFRKIRRCALVLAIPAMLLPASGVRANETTEYFSRHNESASDTNLDFRPWDTFLKKYVREGANGVNRIDYAQVSDEDHDTLNRYIDITLATTQVTGLRRQEQLAFWINLYNALVARVILDRYPVASIRDINISGLFSRGPWKRKLIRIETYQLSLEDIRSGILMPPVWDDPRIRYALCDGTLGSPQIWPEAYMPDRMDFMLNRAAANFINHPRAFSVEGTSLSASSLYTWQRRAFGKGDVDVIMHAIRFANPALVPDLARRTKIDSYFYDWDLNGPDED